MKLIYESIQQELEILRMVLKFDFCKKERNNFIKFFIIQKLYEIQTLRSEQLPNKNSNKIVTFDRGEVVYLSNTTNLCVVGDFKKILHMCFLVLDLELNEREIFFYFNNSLTTEQKDKMCDNVSSLSFLFRTRGNTWAAKFFLLYDLLLASECSKQKKFERVLFLLLELRDKKWQNSFRKKWFKRAGSIKFLRKYLYKHMEFKEECELTTKILKNKASLRQKQEGGSLLIKLKSNILNYCIYYVLLVDLDIVLASQNDDEGLSSQMFDSWLNLIRNLDLDFRRIIICMIKRRLITFKGEIFKRFELYLENQLEPIVKKEKFKIRGKVFKTTRVILYDL